MNIPSITGDLFYCTFNTNKIYIARIINHSNFKTIEKHIFIKDKELKIILINHIIARLYISCVSAILLFERIFIGFQH